MNDLSPPDASAALPNAPPPLAEAANSVEPETPAGPSHALEAAAPIDPLPPEPSLEPASAAPAEAAPEAAPAPGSAPNPFALPIVSETDPCGPDLDLEGDPEFMNFLAATEGLLPASYYAFNRASIDFPAALQTAEALLKRTLDVRLLALMAKLSILNRDIAGFARRLGNIGWLVSEHWEAVNPRPEGDDASGRIAQLMTLEDNAVVLLPLQYAPLLDTNREGVLSYRDQLLATGAVQPRSVTLYNLKGEKQTTEPEQFMAPNAIARVLGDVEIGKLASVAETFKNLGASIQSIRAATTKHVGFENGVELPKLAKLVAEMAEFLRAPLVRRDPSLAPPPEAPPGGRGRRRSGHGRRGAGCFRFARRG